MYGSEKYVPSHRRLADGCSRLECGIDESFLPTNQRIISFHNRPDQYEQHVSLTSNGLQTLEMLRSDETEYQEFALIVPKGAIVLRDRLTSIRRNVGDYSEVFFMVGEYLSELHRRCEVLPIALADRGILESFIELPSDAQGRGISIVLTPPYCLGEGSLNDVVVHVKDELEQSGFFSNEQVETLLEALWWGAHSNE